MRNGSASTIEGLIEAFTYMGKVVQASADAIWLSFAGYRKAGDFIIHKDGQVTRMQGKPLLNNGRAPRAHGRSTK